ncbi:metallophosphoesterase family protein [Salibacterium qingdaonense]|uniref:DNA repair exonuclease SbcCD nuclease subunit n=1 Tax=Salibacterium qingdaonense TaxID=266892 RepID=A0A1I4JAF9_9BACI|nr:DNA repair exonuclease [Salibacterium qingdaonense]SFL63572.1 DNA repair exonuclease SbcCD nuclease subunit [Salibacterium qingdaonense]
MKLRFIHTADLHLGSTVPAGAGAEPRLKEQLENSIDRAVEHMVQDAVELQVDFLIIAGDLFDQENRSLRHQIFLKQQFETLNQNGIFVYLIYGNHDPVDRRYAPSGWPENVHVFDTEPDMKIFHKHNAPAAHLYGCSYKGKTQQNVAAEFIKQPGAPFHIGLLHGEEKKKDSHSYAPFYKEELEEKRFDYWALGHIHTRQFLSERIGYPGNIQGRHRKETGEKGYFLVELNEEAVEVTFRPAAEVVFAALDISIEDCSGFDELTDKVLRRVSEMEYAGAAGLWLEIILSGRGILSDYVEEEKEGWLDILNRIGGAERPFFYVYRLEDATIADLQPESLVKENHFLGDVARAAEKLKQEPKRLEETWNTLHQSKGPGMYLSRDHEEETQDVLDDAERLLWQLWGKETADED